MTVLNDTDGRSAIALQAAYSILIAMGLWNASPEWSAVFTLWALGRPWWIALTPHAVALAMFLCAIAMVIGARVRIAALSLAALGVGLYTLVPAVYHNNYYLLWVITLAIALAPHPEYALRKIVTAHERAPRPWPPVLKVFVRAQLTFVYWASVAVKLTHPMWQGTGHTIQWITTTRAPNSDFGLVNPLLYPVLSRPTFAALSEWGIVALELCLPLLLFNRRTRSLGAVLGVTMHVVMQEWLFPQTFSFIMILGYFAFTEDSDEAVVVRYDPDNAVERCLAMIYPRVDWFGRTRWIAAEPKTFLSIEQHGTTRHRLAALRTLAVLSPVTVLAYAFIALSAPGARTVLTFPRPVVENVLIAIVALCFIPGLLDRAYVKFTRPTTPTT